MHLTRKWFCWMCLSLICRKGKRNPRIWDAHNSHTYRRLLICRGLGSTSLRRSTFQALSLSISWVSRFLSFSRRLSWLTASFFIKVPPPVNSYTEEMEKTGDADSEAECHLTWSVWSGLLSHTNSFSLFGHLQCVRCCIIRRGLSILAYLLVKAVLQILTQGKCVRVSRKSFTKWILNWAGLTASWTQPLVQIPELRKHWLGLGKMHDGKDIFLLQP